VTKTIWKFPLAEWKDAIYTVAMPEDARVLTVARQGDGWFVWAIVDPLADIEKRYFQVIGTGWEFEDDYDDNYKTQVARRYVTTLFEYSFVWHLFEIVPE
jgi:hypothetical protein